MISRADYVCVYREKRKPARLNAIRTGIKVRGAHVCRFTFLVLLFLV